VVSQFLKREPAEANPWDSRGLEWQLPTPIPPHNFDEIPEVLSAPYEYGDPDAPPVADLRPARPRTHQAGTRITGLHGYPVEDPDPTPNTLMVGARLLTAAGIVFFVTFGFASISRRRTRTASGTRENRSQCSSVRRRSPRSW
jgi:hypothetical protein